MKRFAFCLAVSALFAAPAALAHSEVSLAAGTLSGFLHPFAGLDHLLAMIALGLWAAQLGGRALWALPLSFVTTMALGGAVGMAGIDLPAVEFGIGGSVLVFGLLLLTSSRLPLTVGAALAGLFALCHGHAHGTEMLHGASGLLYGTGFVAATALLHGAGIAAARLTTRLGDNPLRMAGSAIAAAGSLLLIGAV